MGMPGMGWSLYMRMRRRSERLGTRPTGLYGVRGRWLWCWLDVAQAERRVALFGLVSGFPLTQTHGVTRTFDRQFAYRIHRLLLM
jgi:hypothetical protein